MQKHPTDPFHEFMPSYWLNRPNIPLDDATRSAFDDLLLAQAAALGPSRPLPYHLPQPKWQFLCYAAEERGLALHGSLNGNIDLFEPRQPHDLNEFGAQLAVYAASDGIWPMYFAIIDRANFSPILVNASISIEAGGLMSSPYYLFSVDRKIHPLQPYCSGYIYLLPKETFITQPPIVLGDTKIHITQLASLQPVIPIAKIEIEPADFPFLDQMLMHDDEHIQDYADAMQNRLPWPELE